MELGASALKMTSFFLLHLKQFSFCMLHILFLFEQLKMFILLFFFIDKGINFCNLCIENHYYRV